MTSETLYVSDSGVELLALLDEVGASADGSRRVIGICGAPGAGKSTVARLLLAHLGDSGAHVPGDGFHLADAELDRQGLLERKGAPETFDPLGYAALLHRVRSRPEQTAYAPGFDRDLEQPLAGAVAVPPAARVVVSEGNYLLLDRPAWRAVRACLDEVWHVHVEDRLRRERLVARHVAFGKTPEAARAWVERVDEPNARLVAASAGRADRLLDLTGWRPGGRPRVREDRPGARGREVNPPTPP